MDLAATQQAQAHKQKQRTQAEADSRKGKRPGGGLCCQWGRCGLLTLNIVKGERGVDFPQFGLLVLGLATEIEMQSPRKLAGFFNRYLRDRAAAWKICEIQNQYAVRRGRARL